MDRETLTRTVLLVIASSAILFVWQYMINKTAPAPIAQPPAIQAPAAPAIPQTAPEIISEPLPQASQSVQTRLLPISRHLYDIIFDESTGDIVSVSMLKYDKSSLPPKFTTGGAAPYFSLTAGLEGGYTAEFTDDNRLSFTAETAQVRIEKSYILTDSYNIPVDIKITNLTDTPIAIPLKARVGPGLGEQMESESYVFTGSMLVKEKEVIKEDEVKSPVSLSNPAWGGNTSKYFLFAVVNGGWEKGEIRQVGDTTEVVFTNTLTVPGGETVSSPQFSVFSGPKEYKNLKSFGVGLQESIDYGIFFFIGIPMTTFMNYAYGWVHNYGLAIIILTVIVKIITLPLTLKSMISMRGMAKLQPEMKELKEKYKEEPQKFSAASMELYKKHKINPLSGCLPMLVQLPIFFALYKSLLVSIELKGAPFFGWIKDLSVHDPFYITPILMGASMFLQQKLTPSTADPTQQKIFLIMPVVFTIFFLKFQSGLVIYWLTNNILSIAQQYAINKKIK
ncbi:MAG: membrane protein insertase YidC [Deferribacteraceae bacterium]|jgi:YidC/Oxa1 family membrane protein insertase|nr:membrane protein insertase YidC [Deferribacteraceae bacterium]